MSIAIINPEHAKTIQPAIDLWTFTSVRKAKAAIITWSLMMATRSTNRGEKYCLALASTQATDTSQHLDEELPTGSIGGKDNGEWPLSDETELEPRVPGVEEAFVLRVLKNQCWALSAAEADCYLSMNAVIRTEGPRGPLSQRNRRWQERRMAKWT